MATFRFEAKDAKGVAISGELRADTERDAAKQLHSQGLFVLRIQKGKEPSPAAAASSGLWRGIFAPVLMPASSKAMSLFFSSFASMLGAGMSLHEAASTLAERAPGRTLKNAAREMAEAALEGKPITTVARRYPAAFTPFVIAMLETGEASGMLERAMRQMSDYFQRSHEIEMAFRFETFYVKLLIIALILLPTAPALVMGGLQAWLPVVVPRIVPTAVGIAAIWYGWRLLMLLPILRRGADRFKLLMPAIGSIVRRNVVAKWCRAMAMLYDAGVPLQLSVEAAGVASGNMALAARTRALAHKVMEGEPISTVMIESGDFPDMAINMMVTGERSGDVSASLTKVAEYCESESQTASKQTAILVGVMAYMVIACIIAFTVISFWSGYFGDLLELAEP